MADVSSFPLGLAASAAERQFVELVQAGMSPSEAASRLRLEAPSRLLERPAVQALMREAHLLRVRGLLTKRALDTLEAVMQDRTCSAAARVAAAKVVLAAAGLLQGGPEPRDRRGPAPGVPEPAGADVPEAGGQPNLDELRSMLARLHERLSRAEPIDVTPAKGPVDI